MISIIIYLLDGWWVVGGELLTHYGIHIVGHGMQGVLLPEGLDQHQSLE